MYKNTIKKCIYNSIFTSLAIILGFLGRLSIFPVFPFLKLDISDIPIYISTILLGTKYGVYSLIVSCLVRSLFFSSAGILGFIMRMVSLVFIVPLGIIYSKKNNISSFISNSLLLIVAALFLLIKVSVNYLFWIEFFNIPKHLIFKYLNLVILPYNTVKLLVNLCISMHYSKKRLN